MTEKMLSISAVNRGEPDRASNATVVTFREFIEANDCEGAELRRLESMEIGDSILFGGGAAQEFRVERVA